MISNILSTELADMQNGSHDRCQLNLFARVEMGKCAHTRFLNSVRARDPRYPQLIL